MKRAILVLVLASAIPAIAEDADFYKLQQSYKAAIQKATAPINKTYETELRKLLEKQTKAGKLDDAKVTMGEIEVVTGGPEIVSDSVSDKEFEKLVVGSTWKHVAGSTITFRKGGEAVKEEGGKKWPLVWRVMQGNIIEATGNFNADGSGRTLFYRIISKKESYYGNSADTATMPLTYVN